MSMGVGVDWKKWTPMKIEWAAVEDTASWVFWLQLSPSTSTNNPEITPDLGSFRQLQLKTKITATKKSDPGSGIWNRFGS